MQNTNINFEDFIRLSKESASRAFHQTEECKLLCANSQRAQQDLKLNFNSEDYSYIEDCFETMMKLEWGEMDFLYRQGFKDCVELLKSLEVLK